MAGRRVFISGVGGELGTQVACLLEAEDWVGPVAGIDADPPRARFRRTTYHRIHPDEHDRIVATVTDFDPHVLVHVGVWEPHSRASPRDAARLTDRAATSILGAAAECRSLEHVVVRSGIEIYGRGRGALTRPDEDADLRPTSGWGRTVADIERTATDVARRVGVTVAPIRLASVIGPHVPSPLGRVLRLPAVPFDLLADPSFAVVHQDDAARAIAAAARAGLAEPVNVVANDSITARQTAARGRRLPVPTLGPQWAAVRGACHLAGAPIPDHVHESLTRGRLADNGRMRDLLGFAPSRTTADVIGDLYGWPSVVRVAAARQVA
ncbi:NAD-dependent epimerase/dehydratase family protein [Ilumatobacter sp.]|uniref:NAD-dependent epimerase/dehydratase family protein n=1 Tax=Ilumatobacter sp. TaxID=1967498 RepID=UPI003B51F3DE